ncbi:MAG: DUF3048 domain-containing protein, partial [Saprospiraceae bacterium]|nr:DUF3048 domain-containing protein [Saprospiraceae bacterium]
MYLSKQECNKMRKVFAQKIIAISLLITIGLSACQSTLNPAMMEQTLQAVVAQTLTAAPSFTPLPSATNTPTPTVTPTPMMVNYGPTNFPANVNPLTGLELEDPSILDRRPVMVKVANQQAGRPHAGLSNADIVFDYYIGNGGDRFLALYYGKDDSKVGTVRSGRMVDVPLVQMYGGILGMISADKVVLDRILGTLVGL